MKKLLCDICFKELIEFVNVRNSYLNEEYAHIEKDRILFSLSDYDVNINFYKRGTNVHHELDLCPECQLKLLAKIIVILGEMVVTKINYLSWDKDKKI
ncbi:MAG: hypothetical protein AABY22_05375 [Nanoarchaeota archaeon]